MFKQLKYLLSPVAVILGIGLLTSCANAQVGSYTTCLTLFKPTPNAAANRGTWGPPVNVDFDIIDQASAGVLALNLPMQSGYPTVTLTSTSGAVDQSKNAHFNFSGTLTANSTVLWPQNLCRTFTVVNNTTGAYTLTIGANNGSGTAAGSTVAIPAGQTFNLYSDGTNVYSASYLALTGGSVSGNVSAAQGLTGVQSGNGFAARLTQAANADSPVLQFTNYAQNSVFGSISVDFSGNMTLSASSIIGVTPNTSDNSTKVPTTAYVQNQFTASQSLAANGYQKFPGGLIEEWGTTSSTYSGAGITISFPIAFPNSAFVVQANPISSNSSPVYVSSSTTSNFVLNTPAFVGFNTFTWFAVGH